jgi:hypothetical protein
MPLITGGFKHELTGQWIGPASSIYFLHSILLEATSDLDGEVAKIMKAFTITVVPTINPDGYTYSRDHSRLWRKNRQDVGGGEQGCYGESMPDQVRPVASPHMPYRDCAPSINERKLKTIRGLTRQVSI